MSQQDSFLIENLEITDEEFLNSRRSNDEFNILNNDGEVDVPVYYSYPYYVLNNSDYQYKLSFDQGHLKLEEVKSHEAGYGHFEAELLDTETCISVIKEHELEHGLKMIEQMLDIREDYENAHIVETDPKWGDILQLDISKFNKADASSALENNKKIVLLDLYKYICSQ